MPAIRRPYFFSASQISRSSLTSSGSTSGASGAGAGAGSCVSACSCADRHEDGHGDDHKVNHRIDEYAMLEQGARLLSPPPPWFQSLVSKFR